MNCGKDEITGMLYQVSGPFSLRVCNNLLGTDDTIWHSVQQLDIFSGNKD